MAVVVTLLNQKGGVGKTSTCHHVAGALALAGKRVLLVDNDPQASLTQGLLGPELATGLDPASTVAALFRMDNPLPSQVIRPTPYQGIDLVAGSEAATEFNVPSPHLAPWELQTCVRELVNEVRDGYDLVLIDCPPNLHLCSWSALAASDHLVVPLQAEDYGSQGLRPVHNSYLAVRGAINPALDMLGYLLTMFNPRAAIHQSYGEMLRRQYADLVFEATVPISLEYKEAIAHRKPIGYYKPRGAAAKAVRAVADELLVRVEQRLSKLDKGVA